MALVIGGLVMFVVGLVGLITSFITQTKKISLDSDQFGTSEFIDISGEDYEKLVSEKKSFLVFVDQDGCITAKGLKEIATTISEEKNLKIYHIMFADARKTSMFENVKYYPSFVIVDKGTIVDWLKADSNDDTERYKNKDELLNWLNKYINWS